jgi:cytochrome c oxidase subunit III
MVLIAIEAAEFLALIVAYFYLRASNDIWPPSGVEKPSLLLPTLSLIVLLVSVIPTTLADKAILKDNVKGMRQGYLVSLILGIIYVVLQVVYYLNLPHTWHDNSYLSLFWTIAGFHLLFVLAMLGETAWVLVLAYQGYFNKERNSAVQADGLNWYFSVALFVVVYVTIYLSPYFL